MKAMDENELKKVTGGNPMPGSSSSQWHSGCSYYYSQSISKCPCTQQQRQDHANNGDCKECPYNQ